MGDGSRCVVIDGGRTSGRWPRNEWVRNESARSRGMGEGTRRGGEFTRGREEKSESKVGPHFARLREGFPHPRREKGGIIDRGKITN